MSQGGGVRQLAVEAQDIGQFLFGGGVHEVSGGAALTAVHAEVEGTVEASREATFSVINLMAGDTQVGQKAIDAAHAVEAKEVLEVLEVLVDEAEAGVVDAVGQSVVVAVESIESPLLTQTFEAMLTVRTFCLLRINEN